MTIGPKPGADVVVDTSLVRALLQEQHPDLAHLRPVKVAEGWDNALFRLGEELAVRLPRRAAAAGLIEHEQRWLPLLSERLPVPVPAPVRVGVASRTFAWAWSVVPWLPGRSLLHAAAPDPIAMAAALEQFLRALHQPAPADAPRNPWRGVPLEARTAALHQHLQQLDGVVDRAAALRLWDRARMAPPWPGPPLWLHGDLHPGNLLVSDDRLSAVIDFGDLTSGDPATDLAVLWMLPPVVRSRFQAWNRRRAGSIAAARPRLGAGARTGVPDSLSRRCPDGGARRADHRCGVARRPVRAGGLTLIAPGANTPRVRSLASVSSRSSTANMTRR